MLREVFLNQYWKPYPASEAGVIDCAEFLQAPRVALVGGRLKGETGAWTLNSAGVTLAIKFKDQAKWHPSCLQDGALASFDSTVLKDGDLLVVELEPSEGHSAVAGGKVSLVFAGSAKSSSVTTELANFSHLQAQAWAKFVQTVRSFFVSQNFLEARTPTLVPSPGTEPFLDPFSTEVTFGAETSNTYLPTSPEFHLKKFLVAGFTRIFELKDCYRNNEGGSHHQAEFLMLEWYRAYATLDEIANDSEKLINAVCIGCAKPTITLKRISIAELFQKHLGFELTPVTSQAELLKLATQNAVLASEDDTWDDVYFRIFLEKIEPTLASEGPCLIHGYPPSQAALARINESGWADRFEIYWNGLEIANAFHELNDPKANEARFKKDAEDRARLAKSPVPHDQDLVAKLYAGMPPSGGIALGMDRLFMAVLGISDIAQTRAFPLTLCRR